MKIKVYPKWRLAEAYFPNCNQKTAKKNFSRLLERDTDLMQALFAIGYKRSHKIFTPAEVAQIFEVLGDPKPD